MIKCTKTEIKENITRNLILHESIDEVKEFFVENIENLPLNNTDLGCSVQWP